MGLKGKGKKERGGLGECEYVGTMRPIALLLFKFNVFLGDVAFWSNSKFYPQMVSCLFFFLPAAREGGGREGGYLPQRGVGGGG